MTNKTKEVLKLALEALEGLKALPGGRHQLHEINMIHRKHDLAITTIKEALALVNKVDQEESSGTEQPAPVAEPRKQGPVAEYIGECNDGSLVQLYDDVKKGEKFYTSPPSLSLAQSQALRADTWVGLTANEVEEIFQKKLGYYPTIYAVEAKLKEKNA